MTHNEQEARTHKAYEMITNTFHTGALSVDQVAAWTGLPKAEVTQVFSGWQGRTKGMRLNAWVIAAWSAQI